MLKHFLMHGLVEKQKEDSLDGLVGWKFASLSTFR
jgi:hypothetical protein